MGAFARIKKRDGMSRREERKEKKMSNKISFDYSKALNVIGENEIQSMAVIAENAKELLVSGKGAGNDFIGWWISL